MEDVIIGIGGDIFCIIVIILGAWHDCQRGCTVGRQHCCCHWAGGCEVLFISSGWQMMWIMMFAWGMQCQNPAGSKLSQYSSSITTIQPQNKAASTAIHAPNMTTILKQQQFKKRLISWEGNWWWIYWWNNSSFFWIWWSMLSHKPRVNKEVSW